MIPIPIKDLELVFSETRTFDLGLQQEGRDLTVKRDHKNGEAGLLERNVTALRFSGNEACPLEGTNCLAAGDSG